MLLLQSPSMVINAHDAPWPRYRMWATVNAKPGTTPEDVVNQIIGVNRLALAMAGRRLANVVINCHGADGGGALYVGGEDHPEVRLNMDRVGVFSRLKPHNIGTLWLVACQAAAGYLGKQLCQATATLGGLQVVAADEDQDTGVWGGWRVATGRSGLIDEFEGTVWRFTVVGKASPIDPHEAIYTILE